MIATERFSRWRQKEESEALLFTGRINKVNVAKNAFAACSVNASGRVLDRKDLICEALSAYLVQLPAGTVVAIEAFSGAHYWGSIASSGDCSHA